ncbi:MAG TPA: PIN domain-containing protein [Planctomycetaceae bacterium]|nr:PIN domain-containing protein [Planctomycetaceae bacterium]HQZ64145.1 PIN domain-containing protein [Planctomycetaceae bacterium]
MADIVVDTCVLAEFLSQYFDVEGANQGQSQFIRSSNLNDRIARELNRILQGWHHGGRNNTVPENVVVISAFAFVELVRQWESIVSARFSLEQLRLFLNDPPTWINIAPLDEDLLPSFVSIPQKVRVGTDTKPIEWADAVHAATAFSRGTGTALITSDERLSAVPNLLVIHPLE